MHLSYLSAKLLLDAIGHCITVWCYFVVNAVCCLLLLLLLTLSLLVSSLPLLLLLLLLLLLVIGFVESEYQGEERGEDHDVLAGYISGLPDNRMITYAPTAITASE